MAGKGHVGRPSSWAAVSVMVLGFAVGGIGLTLGPSWPMFWAGAALVAVGGIVAMAVGIFSDVILDEPRVLPEQVDYSVFGRRRGRLRGGPYGETASKEVSSDPQDLPHG